MKILITGAAGFIGSYLVRGLRDTDQVYGLVRKKAQLEEGPSRTVIECDLSLPLALSVLPKNIDAIVHLAQANVPFPDKAGDLFRVNTVSTQELLDYGRQAGIKSFIYASSGSIYGQGKTAFKEDDIPQPRDFYSVSKYSSELLIGQYRPYFNTAVLRFFAPYGQGQKRRLIPNLIERVKNGEEIQVYNDGNPKMNPIYVTEVVEIIKRLLKLNGHFILNVGGERAYFIKEIADLAGRLTGVMPRYKFLTDPSKQDLFGDISRMKSQIGFEPRISLSEGLRLMVGNQ